MSYDVTILGCGSSGGVPRVALGWGACDPAEPKNRRRRCSILVGRRGEGGTTRVLVDTSPDIHGQLVDAGVEALDAVLFTHEHADHTHGIDDLRGLVLRRRSRLDVYSDEATAEILHLRFGYCFATPPGSDYPPILNDRRLHHNRDVVINGPGGAITATSILLQHGTIPALGFRFGAIAYTPDVSAIPDMSLGLLSDLDVWIIDALRPKPHPSHFSLDEALTWIERLKPKRAILTNMHSDLDYRQLLASLPAHVVPAYDGMRITPE
ncbi:MAG: MBL fold metallo-hydrolase [Hyphomicrobiales bacterium]|nr:MBL fold metallo-hydrolase [Hyphomicrobiales bacterium]OQW82766.1 MAG: phosphoribosyl 1,2-cyclic phosphodiesterase [Proteobacteria bacterium ST_bin15]